MELTSIQNEILQCENRYWDAMRGNDVETAVSLTRFPCLISGPQGTKQVSETEYRKIMEAVDGGKFKGISIENPRVAPVGEDSALITYSTRVNGMKMLDASLWVKDGDEWICGYHSEFPEGLPHQ